MIYNRPGLAHLGPRNQVTLIFVTEQNNPKKIEKTSGLGSLAKLCLNSLWGKFGENLAITQTSFFYDNETEQFIQMLTSPEKEVSNFHIVIGNIIQQEWKEEKGSQQDLKTNIFLAIFTTFWACLELYKFLDKLGRGVLYFDTDSIIYISSSSNHVPPLGEYLGELTPELGFGDVACQDRTCDWKHWIVELIPGGPKNYAYITNNLYTVCKLYGFTLNHKNSQLVNFKTVKVLLLADAIRSPL